MKTLVLFGDSLFAQCSKDEVMFLEAQLNHEYDVYNCAVGGWDTNDLLKKASFISKLQADLVLISIGTNDSKHWRDLTLEQFRTNLDPITEKFNGSQIVFFPPPPAVEDRQPENRRVTNAELRKYNQAVIDFCKDHGYKYWDSWTDLLPLIGTDKDPHNEDGVHFSDPGYELILGHLAKVVMT